MYAEKKEALLAVILHHKTKLDEAAEALDLLNRALYKMDAEEALRDLVETDNPLSQLLASEFVGEALYGPLWAAKEHVQKAEKSLTMFFRLLNLSYGLHKYRGQEND